MKSPPLPARRERVTSFIDGSFVPAGGKVLPVINPADEEVVGELHEADAAEVDAAVRAAERSFAEGVWRHRSPSERRETFRSIVRTVSANLDELAHLETAATGQPYRYARNVQLPRILGSFDFYGDWPLFALEIAANEPGKSQRYVQRDPVGPVALISPSNAPTALAATKIAAALAFGNSCVVKTSEFTPLALARFVELLHEAGVSPGIVNMVNGRGHRTGTSLIEHPLIRAVSFTGGTATAKSIAAAAGRSLKRLDLELGGKSANIVMPSADLDAALDGAVLAAFNNSGQQCFAGSRLVLHRDIADTFLQRLAERADRIQVGHPYDDAAENGPLQNAASYARAERMVAEAVADGGRIIAGGRRADGFDRGYYFRPTIAVMAGNDARLCQQEVFGPVLAAFTVGSIEEAVAVANASDYGLVSYVWTNDLREAMTATSSIAAGLINVNTPMLALDPRFPFGGFKESGVGREGGEASRSFYTEERTVNFALTRPAMPRLGATR